MKPQSADNHTKYQPLQHFVWLPLSFFMLVVSIGYIVYSFYNDTFNFGIFLLLGVVVLAIIPGMLARMYALILQDRLIRTEEQMRYFMLTNKRMDPKITLQQLIALRFASDDEFVELVDKTLAEDLSPKDIKRYITEWRADYNRV